MKSLKTGKLLLTGLVALACELSVLGADVREFGAAGDGKTDDTAAIGRAISESPDGRVRFPRGTYRITQTIEIALARLGPVSLSGEGGVARILMEAPGPAFRFSGTHEGTANPDSFDPETLERERMPQVEGLEIAGTHEEADGLEFYRVMQPTLRGVLIRDVRHGVRLVERNRNLIIESSHIYHCSGIGVFLDNVDLHQAIIQGSHISYCKGGGIVVSGGGIRNLHITGNTIEYNYDPGAMESADIRINSAEGTVREGSIVGNTIQARPSPGGANIRMVGGGNSPGKTGLWSITGNHISNQEINVHLDRTRGVSISGNTFLRGGKKTILVERSRNTVVTGDTIDRHPDYYHGERYRDMADGIRIRESEGVILSGLLIDGARLGDPEAGGAIDVLDSSEVTITGSQILHPRYRGIHVSGSRNVQVVTNTIVDRSGDGLQVAAIEVGGDSEGVLVRGNLVGEGRDGAILAEGEGVLAEGNRETSD